MMSNEKRPLPVATVDAGERIGRRKNPTQSSRIRNSGAMPAEIMDREQLDELAVELISETIRFEARVVSAGFHDPVRLARAAVSDGLDRDDFADQRLGVLFSALVCYGQSGDKGYFSAIPSFCRRQGIPIPAGGWDAFLREHIDGCEFDGSGIERYAKLIKRASRRRRRTARLWHRLADRMTTERDRLAACDPFSAMRLDEVAPKAVRRIQRWSAQAVRAASEIMGGVA